MHSIAGLERKPAPSQFASQCSSANLSINLCRSQAAGEQDALYAQPSNAEPTLYAIPRDTRVADKYAVQIDVAQLDDVPGFQDGDDQEHTYEATGDGTDASGWRVKKESCDSYAQPGTSSTVCPRARRRQLSSPSTRTLSRTPV
jgi:hypothetical protein